MWMDTGPRLAGFEAYLWIIGIIVAVRTAVDILLSLYASAWSYASVADMARILACVVTGTAVSIIVVAVASSSPAAVAGIPAMPFWLLEGALALAALATPRFLIRAASDISAGRRGEEHVERTLFYGAGWAGVMTAKSAERDHSSKVLPVGFLDDDPGLKGRRVSGMRVFGDTRDLPRAARKTRATSLLITMPRATGETVRHVVEAAMVQGLTVRTVPAVTDLLDGSIDATRIRRVRVEDLLRRPPARDHSPALHELLSGQTVMITGAGGSIGSELVRQVIAMEPSRIVMVDQSESALYMCARDVEGRSQVLAGKTAISTHLTDVTDRSTVAQLMRDTSPVVVFHAAAYKHVPLLEDHVGLAVRVNVGGTLSMVDAAVECGVPHFVLVSTDKAVAPTSVMGATKRLAELLVGDAARRTGLAYVSVRFGNVLGSNGSVIPVFQSQLENGRPLTITDPDMTRYFMTIPEAAWLILDAAALSDRGCLYILDMGNPVRVLDVAHDLIRLSGRDPERVPIKVVGLRAGEKLHEELFYANERISPTEVPKVLRSDAPPPPADVRVVVDQLLRLSRHGQDETVRLALLDYVGTERDSGSPDLMVQPSLGLDAEPESGRDRPVVVVPVHGNGQRQLRGTEPMAHSGARTEADGSLIDRHMARSDNGLGHAGAQRAATGDARGQ